MDLMTSSLIQLTRTTKQQERFKNRNSRTKQKNNPLLKLFWIKIFNIAINKKVVLFAITMHRSFNYYTQFMWNIKINYLTEFLQPVCSENIELPCFVTEHNFISVFFILCDLPNFLLKNFLAGICC